MLFKSSLFICCSVIFTETLTKRGLISLLDSYIGEGDAQNVHSAFSLVAYPKRGEVRTAVP